VNTFHIAADVVREAFARKLFLGLFVFITASLLMLVFALDLDVVQGTLAAGRLFGMDLKNPIIPIDVALGKLFMAITLFVFYFGLMFGIIATAGIAPEMLAPGRVELLLSLPIRRGELVVGTYLGVLAITAIATLYAIGGASLILAFKMGTMTSAPAIGAAMAVIGFMPIYALMLFTSTLVRSTTFAAGTGLILYIIGIATSNREAFLGAFRPGLVRDVLGVVIAPIPKLNLLVQIGGDTATGAAERLPVLLPVFGSIAFFSIALIVAASLVVSSKDY
jgi:Cu-processing system permease protein